MSVLTKVFVVLVTVLSVLLATLVVAFVANVEDLRGQLTETRTALAAATAKAATKQAEITSVMAGLSQQIKDLESAKTNLTSEINSLRATLVQRQAELESERASSAQIKADISRLTAANQQHAETGRALQAELAYLRKVDVEQKTKLIQMADRNNELEGQLDTLTRQVRRFRERTVAMQERLAALEQKIRELPPEWQVVFRRPEAEAAEPFVSDILIPGHITQVNRSGEETLVEINVGSNDHVAPNMKFVVYRGNQFLASLIVTAVDADASAGRLEVVQGDVRVGDQVQTGIK